MKTRKKEEAPPSGLFKENQAEKERDPRLDLRNCADERYDNQKEPSPAEITRVGDSVPQAPRERVTRNEKGKSATKGWMDRGKKETEEKHHQRERKREHGDSIRINQSIAGLRDFSSAGS